MAYASIDLSDYIGDFDDDELINEIESRGYVVEPEPDVSEFVTIGQYWLQGNKKEALFLLERYLPDLRGISKLLD